MKTIQTIQTISLRGSILDLQPGETLAVPFGMRSYSYVRYIATVAGMEVGRKFAVHVNRESSTYEITRNS